MKYDVFDNPYPTKRVCVFGKKGMVATSSVLAAQAGAQILRDGGNAIDAAIATAACLTVFEPVSNGIGGDLFALVWSNGKLYGLNASGFSPQKISLKKALDMGYESIPANDWLAVTVPGAPAGWAALSKRFGQLPYKQTLMPACEHAFEGFPISVQVAYQWQKAYHNFSNRLKHDMYKSWFDTFAPAQRAPYPGEIVRMKDHAKTLERIADSDSTSFYQGDLAEAIDAYSRRYGGVLRKTDLNEYEPSWVDPLKIEYKGLDVWEIPPNGQGLVALIALKLMETFDFAEKEDMETYHMQIEAMKLAFAEGYETIADRAHMTRSPDDFLEEGYIRERRKKMTKKAIVPEPTKWNDHGTVYMATADDRGNMVSLIQSNYQGFGTGLVVPNTGIALHNRGCGFSLDASKANCIGPRKKPFHTIIPGFLSKNGCPLGPFGVMGGNMQPQGHLQVLMNMIDFHMNPQQALNAPRWKWNEGLNVEVEESVPSQIKEALCEKGHRLTVPKEVGGFGRGQVILTTEHGTLCAGTEPRTDGAAVPVDSCLQKR